MPIPLNGVSSDLINARSTLLLGLSFYIPVSILASSPGLPLLWEKNKGEEGLVELIT